MTAEDRDRILREVLEHIRAQGERIDRIDQRTERLDVQADRLERALRLVEGHERVLLGDGRQDPGVVGRLRAVEADLERRRWLDRTVLGSAIGAIVTGIAAAAAWLMRSR